MTSEIKIRFGMDGLGNDYWVADYTVSKVKFSILSGKDDISVFELRRQLMVNLK